MRVYSKILFGGILAFGLCACGDDGSVSAYFENEDPISQGKSSSSVGLSVESSSSWFAESSFSFSSSSSYTIFDLLNSSSSKSKSSSSQAGGNSYQNPEENSSSSTDSVGNFDAVRASYFNNNLSYGEMTDPRDNQVYKTIVIGEQTWMAENLNYSGFRDGAYNKYGYTPDSSKKYGVGYQFYKAVYACPENWHLPTTPEWQTLIDYVSSHTKTPVGKALKSETGWPPTKTGTNEFGFNAVFDINDFKTYGIIQAYYWTSTVPNDVSTVRYVFALEFDSDNLREQGVYEGKSQPVRCIKDSAGNANSGSREE